MSLPEYITLNGTNYTTAKLSAEAHVQVQNIQVVDAEIARLQPQTARNAYSNALVTAVKGGSSEVRAPEKKPRSPRKPKAKAE